MSKQLSSIIILSLLTFSSACNVLLLTGGGSYGAYQAGVIARLVDSGKRWDYISGISAGSLNGLFLSALGYSDATSAALRETWSNIQTDDVYKFTIEQLAKSILDNAPLRNTIITVLQKNGLDTLNIPLFTGVVSMTEGIFEEYEITLGQITTAMIELVIASSSVPIVFPMNPLNGDYYIDGATLKNIIISGPILKCFEEYGNTTIEVDIISLGKDVRTVPVDEVENYGIISYAERVLSLLYQNIGDVEIDCQDNLDIVAHRYQAPPLPGSFLTFDHGAELFEMGYNNISYYDYKVC